MPDDHHPTIIPFTKRMRNAIRSNPQSPLFPLWAKHNGVRVPPSVRVVSECRKLTGALTARGAGFRKVNMREGAAFLARVERAATAENALITRLQNVSGATGTQMQVLKTRARRFENEADALERRVAALELAVEEEREYGHGHGHEQGKNDHKYEPDGQQEEDQPESPEEANTDTRPPVPAPERPCRCYLCQMYGHHGRPYAFDGDYEEYMTRTRPDA